jgi:hypothetical protein
VGYINGMMLVGFANSGFAGPRQGGFACLLSGTILKLAAAVKNLF